MAESGGRVGEEGPWRTAVEAVKARAFDYSVSDYFHGFGVGETERKASVTWLFRNFTVSWSGPLSRKARRRQAAAQAAFEAKHADLFGSTDGAR